MPDPILFHFGFSSPYRDLGAEKISSTASSSGGIDRFDRVERWLEQGGF